MKALSTFFTENNLRERRNLRGDIEKRSLYVNEQFESAFREVKEVCMRFVYKPNVDLILPVGKLNLVNMVACDP